ncbi:ubiquinone biosynthesis accessory factor UbiJ [Phytohalomonas tamaricis]|uniref:ubiquinone biosynthesis accessory factor UbiJ n=1 Tax=Phytohalomonas tamaricis TaxID=2081032 RepID=UPI000D0B9944|nr:SCP2 sterol-binding domain-containing protein [Phytohalomonas tamaricis]
MSLFTPVLLSCVEQVINRLLARDPAAPSRLAQLAGHRLLLRLEGPPFEALIVFHHGGVALSRLPGASDNDADVVVEVDADTLGSVLGGANIETLMFEGKLAVRGRISILVEARDLFMDLDIDWEGALAEWFGDIPAHTLATGLRHVGRFGVRSLREFEQDLCEYALEEGRLLAGRTQLEIAREHLTELEIAADRLEARLARLNRQLEHKEHS